MKNFFKGASPGAKFVSKCGDIYMYVGDKGELHELLKLGTKRFYTYNDFGICLSRANHDSKHELSKTYIWPYMDDELETLADDEYEKSDMVKLKGYFTQEERWKDGFMWGYIKAKNGE